MKLMNAALGLMGEAGEVADLIKKKLKIMQDPEHLTIEDTLVKWEQQERFTEEIGDVIWYCVHLCSILGIDFQDVIVGNYEKLSKRYKNIYGGKDYGITRHR
jgi:NTP pyrophosphatase (non-canonical NTP hydrolase)